MCDSCRLQSIKVHVRFDDGEEFMLCLDCATLTRKQEVFGVLEAISGIRERCSRAIAVE